ncbi:uncharacterized protein LOC135385606 isoform X2 [Ornithodoros turicata]|uniref:uncharacterized protein LOC135385606 isoform X2 n=1 Tax=Ornithodoros turicata TaxID=34597 RepID=UPI00313A0268
MHRMFLRHLKRAASCAKKDWRLFATVSPFDSSDWHDACSEVGHLIEESLAMVPGLKSEDTLTAVRQLFDRKDLPHAAVGTLSNMVSTVRGNRSHGSLMSMFFDITPPCTGNSADELKATKRHMVAATRMCHAFQMCHDAVVTTGAMKHEETENEQLITLNKLMTLVGDFFIVNAAKLITDFRDNEILYTFAKGLEFCSSCDFNEPPGDGVSVLWWEEHNTEKHFLFISMLEIALLLKGTRCEEARRMTRLFGRNLVLALQDSPKSLDCTVVRSRSVQQKYVSFLLEYLENCEASQEKVSMIKVVQSLS